jgi:hypothetical protein
MVEIEGRLYYIDLTEVTERCKISKDNDDDEGMSINVFKFDIIKMCIERILTEFNDSEEDIDILGNQKHSISFKIAFNTLIKNNILVEDEDDE